MTSQKYADEFYSHCREAFRYDLLRIVGKGSYGIVFKAVDTLTGQYVAIKRILNAFDDKVDAVRMLREMKLLRIMKGHPNIVRLISVLNPVENKPLVDVYMVFELMDSDMRHMLKLNSQNLKEEHFLFFFYQMLIGLEYLHSLDVYHRDMKPQNMLVNRDCTLKICDFGLSRVATIGQNMNEAFLWTNYVVTRWYRPPELCGRHVYSYSKSIDIWSLGCIFAEMIRGKPLFKGQNSYDQLYAILDILGKPEPHVLDIYYSPEIKGLIKQDKTIYRTYSPKQIRDCIPQETNEDLIMLISAMLEMDPSKRPTAQECLMSPYFDAARQNYSYLYKDTEKTILQIPKEEFQFESKCTTVDDVKQEFYKELRMHYSN
jgi:mitogen-activated protein kinase 1/3